MNGAREGLRPDLDVVVLDLMLPSRDGFEVCKDIRAQSHVPIIVVTARVDVAARVLKVVIDTASQRVTLEGEQLALTSYEFAILRVLAENEGRVLSRERLLDLAKGNAEEAFDRSIDVRISRLRQKLGEDRRSSSSLTATRRRRRATWRTSTMISSSSSGCSTTS